MYFIRRKYQINPQTLRIEEVKLPLGKRLFITLLAGVIILSLSISIRIIYDRNAPTPRLAQYEKRNEMLRQEFEKLQKDLLKDEKVLSKYEVKDDRMYRTVFEMNPIPSSIREAGTGGAVMHPELQAISKPELIISAFETMDKVLSKAKIQSSSFEDLQQAAINKRRLMDNKPSILPIAPNDPHWLTSTFGYRSDPFNKRRTFHHGIDLSGPLGLNVHATGDGTVILAQYNRFGYGKEVVIDHGFGYQSRYAHLNSINVERGDIIKRGQILGKLGSTGRSTGPHLHYEVRYLNKPVNPFYYFYDELSGEEYSRILKIASLK